MNSACDRVAIGAYANDGNGSSASRTRLRIRLRLLVKAKAISTARQEVTTWDIQSR